VGRALNVSTRYEELLKKVQRPADEQVTAIRLAATIATGFAVYLGCPQGRLKYYRLGELGHEPESSRTSDIDSPGAAEAAVVMERPAQGREKVYRFALALDLADDKTHCLAINIQPGEGGYKVWLVASRRWSGERVDPSNPEGLEDLYKQMYQYFLASTP
jgi:hypothetical protein